MINQKTRDLIVEFEGLRTTAYKDGGGVWTIGVGHTSDKDQVVYSGLVITKQRAYELLDLDLAEAERAVKTIKTPLTANQYGALVSLAFNIGSGAFLKSTLVRKLNTGDYKGAANQFDVWVNDNGKRVNGLVRRRAAEKALFLSTSDVSQTPVEPPVVSEPPKHGEAPVAPVPARKNTIWDVLFEFLIMIFRR